MKKKNITIDDLAMMVQKGFDGVQKGFEETAKKKDMEKRFKDMDNRFDKIERLILADHKRRIEKLEIAVRDLKEMLAFS